MSASTGSPAACRSTAAEAQAGFTLVEVLCAAAVAALSFGVLLQALGGSLGAARRLDDHTGARIVAASVLADARQMPGVDLGSTSGRNGRYRWVMTAARSGRDLAVPPGWTLYRVTVEVTWPPRGSLELSTVKLAR